MRLSSGAHVQANGIRQHYLHFAGTGPTLVIVPGIVSPAILWRHVGEWLGANHNCFVLDVRGRGLSESGAHLDYGFDACAADLVEFVRTMALNPVIAVGHSMGARIVLRSANRSPEMFGSIVLVDPPTSGPGRRPYPVPKSRTLALLHAAYQGRALEAIRASSAKAWPDELQRLRAEWLSSCDERAVHAAYDDFHAQDPFEGLARIAAPVSLIAAGDGGVVSDSDVEEMRSVNAALRVVRLAGAGHQMQAEDFAKFSAALAQVLQEHRHATSKDMP